MKIRGDRYPDTGGHYAEVRERGEACWFTAHLRACEEADFKARGWGVERTYSWLNRFRRILIRWEKWADTYLARNRLTGIVSKSLFTIFSVKAPRKPNEQIAGGY